MRVSAEQDPLQVTTYSHATSKNGRLTIALLPDHSIRVVHPAAERDETVSEVAPGARPRGKLDQGWTQNSLNACSYAGLCVAKYDPA